MSRKKTSETRIRTPGILENIAITVFGGFLDSREYETTIRNEFGKEIGYGTGITSQEAEKKASSSLRNYSPSRSRSRGTYSPPISISSSGGGYSNGGGGGGGEPINIKGYLIWALLMFMFTSTPSCLRACDDCTAKSFAEGRRMELPVEPPTKEEIDKSLGWLKTHIYNR